MDSICKFTYSLRITCTPKPVLSASWPYPATEGVTCPLSLIRLFLGLIFSLVMKDPLFITLCPQDRPVPALCHICFPAALHSLILGFPSPLHLGQVEGPFWE